MNNNVSHDTNDKTSAQALRQSLNACEAQLAQTQQEISGLLYAISHDLRAPLRAITGFNQALQEHLAAQVDDTGKHFLQRLEQSAQRMSSMIDALMSLARIAQADMILIDFDLASIAQEAVTELAARYPQHQPLVSITSPLPIHGDARLLKQALTKLLENAWKCTVNHPNPHIEIGTSEEAKRTAYFVRDNGIGFDMALANKLFIPFQQLHGSDALRGQGLGLAIAQRIIARHGGRIWAQAEPHHGAQFFFSLPS
jgi:light-regulated signal transduction histidine kinase (bacteriophytochrome)